MLHPDLNAGKLDQAFPQRFGNRDRSMPASRAPDAYRQVRLSFLSVLRDEETQQVQRMCEEFLRGLGAIEIAGDLRVASGERPQRRHEVWVRQEADVEQQVG